MATHRKGPLTSSGTATRAASEVPSNDIASSDVAPSGMAGSSLSAQGLHANSKEPVFQPFSSVRADALIPLPQAISVCATVDESGTEQVVTELMIRRACEVMDAEQIWPVVNQTRQVRKRTVSAAHSLPAYGSRSGVILRFPSNRLG